MRSIIVNSFREHVPNCVPERTFYVLRTDATKVVIIVIVIFIGIIGTLIFGIGFWGPNIRNL